MCKCGHPAEDHFLIEEFDPHGTLAPWAEQVCEHCNCSEYPVALY